MKILNHLKGPGLGILLILAANPVFALKNKYANVSREAILALTDMAFVGTVIEKSTRWATPQHSMIATDYGIKVESMVYDPISLLGATRVGDNIILTFAGGKVGDSAVWIPDVPTFNVGETCVFLLQKENLGAISPLVAADRGVYRVRKEGSTQRVYDSLFKPINVEFFSKEPARDPTAITLERFLSDLSVAIPRAKKTPSLLPRKRALNLDEFRNKIFTGDDIPQAIPYNGIVAHSLATEVPTLDRGAKTEPEWKSERVTLSDPYGIDEINSPVERLYSFLWASPDVPSVYNIPPIYYSGAQWGLNFEYSESDWNRYATDIFRKYTTSDNFFGHNQRNDFAFTTNANFQLAYGFIPSSGWLGIAVMYNSSTNSISPNEKIYESDVILNVDEPWTLDFQTAYQGNGAVWYFRSTAVHELGHTIGREHQFTGSPAAQWHSVMNYPPSGALDTEFYAPFMDDAASIRAAYPARQISINDMGVYLFRTNGTGSSPGGVPVDYAGFPTSVNQGGSFTISNFAIENLGTVSVNPIIDWYLTTENNSYAGTEYYLGQTTHPSLGVFSYLNSTRILTVPITVPAGDYWISAYAQSDDNNWNRAAWTETRIRVLNVCYTLATQANPPAGGSVNVNTSQNCSGGYTSGTGISLTAVPAANYVFTSWSGIGGSFSNSFSATTTFTITGNASVTANFAYLPCYPLITLRSPLAGGSVTANTSQNCSGGYTSGTVISLQATAAANALFVNWTGIGGTFSNANAASTSFTITGNATVTANFAIQPPALSVSPPLVPPGGSITATWANIASPTANDWIALYASSGAANTAYLSYRYTNALAGSNLPFYIPSGTAAGTSYELRLFTNGSYTRLATSNSFTVQVPALDVSPTTVSPGTSVTATWTNIPSPTVNDWIALYASSGAINTAYLSYRYTNGLAGGSVALNIPSGLPAGVTYQLRLFSNGGYTRLATSNFFTVQVTNLSVSPTTVSPGESVTATWISIPSPAATDWIGLYATSTAANSAFLRYQYTNGQASSNATFPIPAGAAPGATYQLRLFSNGGYTRLATSNSFTIQAPTLSVSPTTVAPGGAITATWANIAGASATDWIGLYSAPGAANNAFVSYRYTNGQASSNLPFTIPMGVAPGAAYELRLFRNNSYTRLATSNNFTVQMPTLSVSPAVVAPGGSVVATWTNIASPTATDWIGFYATSGAANNAFLRYQYTNGLASGNAPFTIPGGAAPGTTYELRLFRNNNYTRLATSSPFTVQSGSPITLLDR